MGDGVWSLARGLYVAWVYRPGQMGCGLEDRWERTTRRSAKSVDRLAALVN